MSCVLIVDDEPNLRLLYETELRRAGYKTLTAANASQCLESMQAMHPDLVILDIRMPGMDGVEVLQRIRAEDGAVPVIINTAYDNSRENYLTWTADVWMKKTADLSELTGAVERLLSHEAH